MRTARKVLASCPPQNVVALFEGTNNTFKAQDTNVSRVARELVVDACQAQPLMFDGVGTSGIFLKKLRNWATGDDALDILRNAYEQTSHRIIELVRADSTYRLFVFGFSRGATLARALCFLLTKYGASENPDDINILFANFKAGRVPESRHDERSPVSLFSWRNGQGRPLLVDVHYLGLWDTVNTTLCVSTNLLLQEMDVRYVRHAVSIDECRSTFDYVPYVGCGVRGRKELFFSGTHSDVGGSKECCLHLGGVSFAWVVNGAIRRGLRMRRPMYSEVLDFKSAKITDSSNHFSGLGRKIVRWTDSGRFHASAVAFRAYLRRDLSLREAKLLNMCGSNLVKQWQFERLILGHERITDLRCLFENLSDRKTEALLKRHGLEGKMPSEPKIVVTAEVGGTDTEGRALQPSSKWRRHDIRLWLTNLGRKAAYFVEIKANPPAVNYSYEPCGRIPFMIGEFFGCRSVCLKMGDIRAFAKEHPQLQMTGIVTYYTLDGKRHRSRFGFSLGGCEDLLDAGWRGYRMSRQGECYAPKALVSSSPSDAVISDILSVFPGSYVTECVHRS